MDTAVADLIERMGGPAAVEAATTVPAGRVAVWKARKLIPRDAWPAILKGYPDTITLDDLIAADPNQGRPTFLKKDDGQDAAA